MQMAEILEIPTTNQTASCKFSSLDIVLLKTFLRRKLSYILICKFRPSPQKLPVQVFSANLDWLELSSLCEHNVSCLAYFDLEVLVNQHNLPSTWSTSCTCVQLAAHCSSVNCPLWKARHWTQALLVWHFPSHVYK